MKQTKYKILSLLLLAIPAMCLSSCDLLDEYLLHSDSIEISENENSESEESEVSESETGGSESSTSETSESGTSETSESENSETSESETSESGTSEVDPNQKAYTIMVYMCGSDLESDSKQGGLASANIREMLSVNLPDDINLIIETGGAKRWYYSGISADKLGRYYVKNKKLNADPTNSSLKQANMGLTSTFQSFLEWGLTNYPAEKTGIIMWNHGGAMDGVCYDENYDYDTLLNHEVHNALKNAFKNVGRSQKLEWIGYDACLMSVLDIADFNSDYFKYMVSSQESEPGEGWDYDGWLTTLASNPRMNTKTFLSNIVDTYVAKVGDVYNGYADEGYPEYRDYNDATLAVYDLSKVKTLTSAWETMASALRNTITSKSTFKTFKSEILNKCQRFGYDEDYGYTFDVFDIKDFIEQMKKNSTYKNTAGLDAIKSAYEQMIVYNVYGKDIADACGLNIFAAVGGYSVKNNYSNGSNLTNWIYINSNYGSWYRSR